MIRILLVFVILSIIIHFGIISWRNLNGKQRWGLTKVFGYSIMVALLAISAMVGITLLF